MMETLISLTNMVNKTFNEMDMLEHQIKKIGSDIENLKQKGSEQGNKLYTPCGLSINGAAGHPPSKRPNHC